MIADIMHSRNGAKRLMALWAIQLWCSLAGAVSLQFLYPQADMTFYYMNTVAVKYESNYTNPYLYTYCRTGTDGDPFSMSQQYSFLKYRRY